MSRCVLPRKTVIDSVVSRMDGMGVYPTEALGGGLGHYIWMVW
jgi:hypothetical protein